MIEQLRAHGFDPGPRQRPRAAGAMSAMAASPVALFVLARAHVFQSSRVAIVAIAILVIEGVAYAQVFRRAANDRRGGWMFGMSFGFAAWMLVVAALHALGRAPIGVPAMAWFGALVLHGALMGLVFPWIHACIKRPLHAGNQYTAIAPGEPPSAA